MGIRETTVRFLSLLSLWCVALVADDPARFGAEACCARDLRAPAQGELKPLLNIQWRLGPDYPMGIQESAVGVVHGKIVSAGGFTRHPLDIVKKHPDAFGGQPNGFTKLTFVFDRWTRLQDMPHGSNRRALAYADRYIVLLAGFKYAKTRNMDGSVSGVYSAEEKSRRFLDFFERTVLVYDTKTDRLGTADRLIEQTCYPSSAIIGDTLYCLGGEGGPRLYHPATLQFGKILEAIPHEGGVSLEKTAGRLKANRPVTIVCLGDSVTGIYYHTGGRRAYPEMIPLAIRKVYPQAAVTAINAGISGNSTVDGLKRLQKDVLDRKPDLVTVMFGLNDMVRVPLAEFRANLGQIIRQCRNSGAEVLLCTPNSVIDTPGRPRAKLVDYCDAIRQVARNHQVPVCDIHAAYEAIRVRNPLVWRLLLSDEIHPNMDGHKLNAEEICRSITGQAVSLRSARPPQPAIPKTLALLKAGKPVRVLAMPPYDSLIGPAFQALVPAAKIEVTGWPTVGRTLAEIEETARKVRATHPDLVLVAVPAAITPGAEAPPEETIRAYSWVLNWSLSFGQQEWDVVGIAPSVLKVNLTPDQRSRDEFARRRILAQDLSLIARPNNDPSPPEQILENWLRQQLTENSDNGRVRRASSTPDGTSIDFEDWARRPVRRFSLGPGAEVAGRKEKPEAHGGDACLRATGKNESLQYFAILEPVLVRPDTPYDVSFFYRTTPLFNSYQGLIVSIYYLNEKSEQTAAPEWWEVYLSPADKWTEARRTIVVPKGTHHLRVMFRLQNAMPTQRLWLDDLKIQVGQPRVALRFAIDPERVLLSGSLETTANAIDMLSHYSVVVAEQGGRKREFNLPAGRKEFSIDLSAFPEGVKLTIRGVAHLRDGRTLTTEDTWERAFHVFKQRPWENNRLGELHVEDPAPAPWTSVKYDAARQTVSDWNNRIELTRGLLIQTLSYEKPRQQILRKPMDFYLNGTGISESFHFGAPKAVLQAKHKVALASSGTGKRCDIYVRLESEFDGFSKYTVTLDPEEDLDVDRFTMVMHFPRAFLEHVIRSGGAYNADFRPVSLRGRAEWSDKEFRPEIWFGNIDTGLSWCADRILPSKQIQRRPWVEAKLGSDEAEVRFHLVNEPVRLAKGKRLTMAFALMPTPARPHRKETRDVRFGALDKDSGETMMVLWPAPTWNIHCGYPEANSERAMQDRLKGLAGYCNVLVYMGPGWADQSTPPVTYFKSKWLISGPLSHSFNQTSAGFPAPYTSVKLGEKSWVDLYCWKAAEFLRRFPSVRGFYFDCWNGQCYEDENGFLFPTFAARELHKRLYVILRRAVPDAWVIYHTSYTTGMPESSFGDITLGGEHYTAALMERSYYPEIVPMDDLRIDLASNLGPVRMLLPNYYQPEKQKDRGLATHAAGLAMGHGALLWPAFTNLDVIRAMQNRLWSFGKLSQCVFYPYWKANPWIAAGNPKVLCSLYEKQGSLLVILMNSTAQPQRTAITLTKNSLSKLSDKEAVTLYDPVTDTEGAMKLHDAQVDVTLGPYLAKFLTVKPALP